MPNLYVQETWINKSAGHGIGESEVYEAYTDDAGCLFRDMQREHGRCEGKCYIDTPDGGAQQVGWVFLKRRQYEDCAEPYLAETWVTVHTAGPTRTVEYHYAAL